MIEQIFARRPLVANCVSGGSFVVIGDLVCQCAIEDAQTVDVPRARAMAVFGAIYTGGVCYKLYSTYPRILPAIARASPKREALSCTVMDNFLHLPFL